jgi:ParB family transcriptional regulator, chromosome partitioning protein
MADTVKLLDPKRIEPNPDNPRLIFREDELASLADSIAKQGILVPLTVYEEGKKYRILDGERRWRCSLRLGLTSVPVIIQPQPDKMTNIMMMFAIHNARKDWDPLPTAIKLEQLESEYAKRHGTNPTETEIAGLASLSRGEVRRLKKLLKLPTAYRTMLLKELEKPRSEQLITVDHVIEAGAGVESLVKQNIISPGQAEPLRRVILKKFRTGVIDSTVAPRKLVNLARAVERKEVDVPSAKAAISKLSRDKQYSISQVYKETVERADFEHSIYQTADRLIQKLEELRTRGKISNQRLKDSLATLRRLLGDIL